MGVHGLWKLIESTGKPVPIETLENKVLAIDVSIWLHQAVRGFQDSKGAPLPNAHLLGIYHRVCKLLYFRIKPVFIFDGGVPVLKKETIAKRNQLKTKNQSEADRIHKHLLKTILKHSAINKVLSEQTKASIAAPIKKTQKSTTDEDETLYQLPPSQLAISSSSSSSDVDDDDKADYTSESLDDSNTSPTKQWDLHSIDTKSIEFNSLPLEVRHEILSDLKETRKQSSWGRINELPTEGNDFAIYQMKRLLNRQSVQTALEEAEKEMGGYSLSLGELETLLKDQGVITNTNSLGSRIASDENKRYVLIKDIRQAIEEAKNMEDLPKTTNRPSNDEVVVRKSEKDEVKQKSQADLEYENDLKEAIALSLQDEPSTSKDTLDSLPSTSKELSPTITIEDEVSALVSNMNREDSKTTSPHLSNLVEKTEVTLPVPQNSELTKLESESFPTIISNEPSTSVTESSEEINKNKLKFSFLESITDGDFQSPSSEDELEEVLPVKKLSSAQNYMMEYSGLTPSEITKIINKNTGKIKIISNKIIKGPDNNTVNENEKLPIILENKTKSEETSVEIMSEDSSDDNDFMDVTNETSSITPKAIGNKALEIVINANESNLDDDLFGDIFVSNPKEEKKEPNNILEEQELIDKEIQEKISDEIQKDTVTSLKEKLEKCDKVVTNNKEKHVTFLPVPTESKDKSEENHVVSDLVKSYSTTENKTELSVANLKEMKDNLRKEEMELTTERSTKERMAGNISDQMYQEAQELLELFGVPYVVAPMEAEAQCAFLNQIDLIDGVITDDSDVWLFGGKTVYKNFFSNHKHLMEFNAQNILHHFKLSRDQMILLALLVGSDYTTGLPGIGPVTALEILATFPPKKSSIKEISVSQFQLVSGLVEFKSWVNSGKLPGPGGRTSLRTKLKNVILNEHFPSVQVVQAYLEPKVDTNKEHFSWVKPDIVGLIEFARQKFGWTKKKSEAILNPVLKKLQDTLTQTKIQDYFRTKFKINSLNDEIETEKKMSKRVKVAVNKIGKGPVEEVEKKVSKTNQKRRIKATKNKKKKQTSDEELLKAAEEVEGDSEVKNLKEIQSNSQKRVKEIEVELKNKIKEIKAVKATVPKVFRRKEIIPQKEREKNALLKNKLKAIEIFRKSKQGPGFIKHQKKAKREPKEDAELSESSSSS